MNYSQMTLVELVALPGVRDLKPLTCRANFAKSLKLEAEGNHSEAEQYLLKAIETEEQK